MLYDLGYVIRDLYVNSRFDQSCWNCFWIYRDVWAALGKRLNGWTALFLATTVATSVTGFGFPFHGWTPPYTFTVISLVFLIIAILARYTFHLSGKWNRIYVITAAISLYLNAFVAIVQAFLKIPSLKAIAPKQTEPPFLIAQLLFLALFVALTIAVAIRFPKRSLAVA